MSPTDRTDKTPKSGNVTNQNKTTREANRSTNLESHLVSRGIAIAIDKKTGTALLLFTEEDAAVVQNVADVYRKPFEVILTPLQRKELSDSLEYYNRIQKRQA